MKKFVFAVMLLFVFVVGGSAIEYEPYFSCKFDDVSVIVNKKFAPSEIYFFIEFPEYPDMNLEFRLSEFASYFQGTELTDIQLKALCASFSILHSVISVAMYGVKPGKKKIGNMKLSSVFPHLDYAYDLTHDELPKRGIRAVSPVDFKSLD